MLMQVNFQFNLRRVVLMSQYSHTYPTIFRTTQATISFIKGTEQESAYPWTRHIAPLFSGPAILYCYNSNLNWSCPDLSSALQHVMPSSSLGSNILPSWYWPVDVVRENIWSVPCPSNYAVIGGFSAAGSQAFLQDAFGHEYTDCGLKEVWVCRWTGAYPIWHPVQVSTITYYFDSVSVASKESVNFLHHLLFQKISVFSASSLS